MQTQETLKKKISTVHDLLSVVKTMKSLAAVNIHAYEQATSSLAEYEHVVDLSWRALFPRRGLMLKAKEPAQMVLFAIGSDQGMCGQFNETAAEQAHTTIKKQEQAGREVLLWTSGVRLMAAMEDAGHTPHRHFDLPGSLPGVTAVVGQMRHAFAELQQQQGVQRFLLAHNTLRGQSSYVPSTFQVLPLDATWREQLGELGWPGKGQPMFGVDVQQLFRSLFSQYLFVSLYRGLAQSMAAENAARLAAMQAAEKNILELEDELQSKYRETRQKAITEELFDVISGFEALEEG